VLLAGDAAHCHSPVGGRGMNLGIADAADLAERIAAGTTEGYSRARHAAGAEVMAFSERGRKALQSTNPVVRTGVIGVMALLGLVPPLARLAATRLASG
jgi:2-polyprenyl-6-methoxyphenol hydroxylase-like FAD-dependent oxidoreductase